jgi:hypothetical protein
MKNCRGHEEDDKGRNKSIVGGSNDKEGGDL